MIGAGPLRRFREVACWGLGWPTCVARCDFTPHTLHLTPHTSLRSHSNPGHQGTCAPKEDEAPSKPNLGVSQCSLHNAPIFRLLLKVAVNGTHQCESLNFCGTYVPIKAYVIDVCVQGMEEEGGEYTNTTWCSLV